MSSPRSSPHCKYQIIKSKGRRENKKKPPSITDCYCVSFQKDANHGLLLLLSYSAPTSAACYLSKTCTFILRSKQVTGTRASPTLPGESGKRAAARPSPTGTYPGVAGGTRDYPNPRGPGWISPILAAVLHPGDRCMPPR